MVVEEGREPLVDGCENVGRDPAPEPVLAELPGELLLVLVEDDLGTERVLVEPGFLVRLAVDPLEDEPERELVADRGMVVRLDELLFTAAEGL